MQIIWFTGQSGSGKTTLAKALQNEWPCLIIDGNEMRDSISLGAGFSREDRTEHNLRVARLAKVLSKQMNIIVAVIAPIKHVREKISVMMPEIKWIYIDRDVPEREDHFYEVSDDYPIVYNDYSIEGSIEQLEKLLGIEKKKYSLFIGRWQSKNALHTGHLSLFRKVQKEGKNIAIGIRDTEQDENNPLTATQRLEMIQEQVPDAKVFIMPDIEEIVFGRSVGWGMREIRLDEETESISATEIRKNNA